MQLTVGHGAGLTTRASSAQYPDESARMKLLEDGLAEG